MAIKFGSCFELAFRRALFAFLLLISYLAAGTIILYVLVQIDSSYEERRNRPIERQVMERLDFVRDELLNVLWAEALASRSESDWLQLSNAKLDAYEKQLLASSEKISSDALGKQNNLGILEIAKSAFLMITTIGGGKFSDDTFEPLSAVTKLFLVVFALVGIPLMLIYLGQCVKAVRAVTDDNGWGEWICALFFAVVALVVTAISLDITETNREDVSFVDALFAAFLVLTTIGGDRAQVDSFSTPLLFAYCMLLLAVFSLAFAAIQRQIERRIAKHEFAFSCRVGKFERVVSETRLLCSVREDEEPPPEEDAGKNRVVGVVEIPVLLNKRHSWSRSAAEDKNDGEEDIDSPAATNPFSMIG